MNKKKEANQMKMGYVRAHKGENKPKAAEPIMHPANKRVMKQCKMPMMDTDNDGY